MPQIVRQNQFPHWKLHEYVRLRVLATKSLKVDYQNGWRVVQLNFLECLLMLVTLVAVPCIRL